MPFGGRRGSLWAGLHHAGALRRGPLPSRTGSVAVSPPHPAPGLVTGSPRPGDTSLALAQSLNTGFKNHLLGPARFSLWETPWLAGSRRQEETHARPGHA